CGFGCQGTRADIDLIDARTLQLVSERHTTCYWIRSLAFDAAGLVAGLDYCKGYSGETDERVVQYSADLRAQLFQIPEAQLPKCSVNSPDVASGGPNHD